MNRWPPPRAQADALGDGEALGQLRAPRAFVEATLKRFERHANTYDAAYAEKLAARLAEAEAGAGAAPAQAGPA